MRRILILILLLLPALAFNQTKIDSTDQATLSGTSKFPTIDGPQGAKRWKYFDGDQVREFSAADIINRAYIPSESSHSIEDDYGNFIRSTVDDNNIYYCDYDGNCRLVTTGSGGLATVDTAESFTTELAFFENREIGPYQVAGNVTFSVNDSAAVVGAFTTYRMNFGADSLYSVSFSGSEFDSVQQYNINSGDTLTGIHILDFWYTRWGVAVNVPTNGAGFSETTQDTVANPTSNPFQEKSGLLVEFDGFYGRSTSSDTIIWASNEGSPTNRAVSTDLSKKPSYSGTPGMTFANNGAFLDLDTNFSPSSGNVAVTIAWNAAATTANNDFFGQNTDVASFDFHRNGSVSNIFYAWGGISMTPGVLDVGPEIIQLSCNSGTCELWMDGVSKGTDSTGMSDTVITILGSLNKTGSTGVNGTIYHIAVHDNPYTAQERSDAFDYVNDRYSMGL
jgi:hypothetical protein